MAINNNKKTNSYHNLHGDASANRGAFLNGKSQINLKQLLFWSQYLVTIYILLIISLTDMYEHYK